MLIMKAITVVVDFPPPVPMGAQSTNKTVIRGRSNVKPACRRDAAADTCFAQAKKSFYNVSIARLKAVWLYAGVVAAPSLVGCGGKGDK